jgi:hypothetical protein
MAVKLSAHTPAALYSPRTFQIYISARGCVDRRTIMRLEELGETKNKMTSGIESMIFRLLP